MLRSASVDERGSTALLFAIACCVLLAVVGAAIDFARAFSARSAMQASADASALAVARLQDAADANVQAVTRGAFWRDGRLQNRVVDAVVTPEVLASGGARVTATAKLDTMFLKVLGFDRLSVGVLSEVALGTAGQYVDLHIIADGSPHIEQMIALFDPYPGHGGGCAFACHRAVDPLTGDGLYNGKTGRQIAQENGIKLREDTIKEEIQRMLSTLEQGAGAGRFRVSLRSVDGTVTRLTDLSSDFAALRSYVTQIPNRSDGTILQWHLPDIARALPSGGIGTQTSPKGIVLLITDGVDYQIGAGATYGFDASKCQAFKDNGLEVYVLNMLYPDRSMMFTDATKLGITYDLLPAIQTALQACASPGRYFEAGYADSIVAAFATIGQQIAGGTSETLRLTK